MGSGRANEHQFSVLVWRQGIQELFSNGAELKISGHAEVSPAARYNSPRVRAWYSGAHSQGATVSVTEFKLRWRAPVSKIGGGDPEMKLVPRTIWPVQTSLHKLFKIKYTTYFWFRLGNPDFSCCFSKFPMSKNSVRWIPIGNPIVNAAKRISSKRWRFLSNEHFPLTYGLHIPRARSTIFL